MATRNSRRRGGGRSGGTAEGQVALVYKKDMRGGPLYSIKLEDDDNWYRCNKTHPDVEAGEYITFKYKDERGQKVVDLDSIEVLEEAAEEKPKRGRGNGKSKSGGNSYGGSQSGTPNLKDMRITLLSARNSAIEVVKMALEHNALVLPAKTKVGERHTALIGIIDNLTREYFFETLALTDEDYREAVEYIENGSEYESEDYYEDEYEEEEYEEGEEEYEEGDD